MFNSWRLSKKMLVAFAIIGLILSCVAGAGVIAVAEIGAIATRHVERGIAGTEALGRMMSALREHRIIIFSSMNSASAEEDRKYQERFENNRIALSKAVKDYDPLAGDLTPKIDAIKQQIHKLDEVNGRIFALRKSRGAAAALPLVKTEGRDVSQATLKMGEDLLAAHMRRAANSNTAGQAYASTAVYIVLSMSIIGLAVLFSIWFLIGKTVSGPMAELSKVTKLLAEGGKADVPHRSREDELGELGKAVEQFRLAAVNRAETDARHAAEQQVVTSSLRDGMTALTSGDLTAVIQADFPPAYAELKTNFNEALASLRGLIGSVSQTAISVSTGSHQIAHASEDLARRTESNAASLEETSAAVQQIDARLKATARAAERSVVGSTETMSAVVQGRERADQAVQAMGRVSDSAKGIDSVIEGLDKIAFQTRVLAMNAAVEAGRAGDAGRGFAVVADLVSALAMRAEEEAKRARNQLTVTQTEIVAAVEAVQKVDGALTQISGAGEEAAQLAETIAADNEAQASAITEVASAIASMDQATQQNAAMVEETSAAARNLQNEVTALTEQAGRFNVGSRTAELPTVLRAPGTARTTVQKPVPAKRHVSPVKPLTASLTIGDEWTSF